ncbi:A24 family peptidase [[Haemophilus] ducreyi]|uniref:Flp operon protein B n=1 Tax=Haemophilus ducreyi TaxID=730 RepID=A0AAC8ZAK5_HAEDC|nr:prepilin peptidase [[Haemophilus] ducreyi]AKO31103.1 flp operon protein B [[Haemophilus] ducreyi]AKO32548.1 flp operon protein B [[Haemophilus] ducreyi]AKO33999.1 flp operon protein B [[Haemophilus] ducreyi]AKO35446.1 flp operon protein B [[Haemophilus] ducreyi]ANF60289.1 flp operon protein B [[Haemophilus] ducreyi]
MYDYAKLVLFSFIVLLLIWLSYTDIRSRIITNKVVLALFCAILPFSWFTQGMVYPMPALICLVIGFVLFMLGVIGAGDAKLMAVLMLAVPPEYTIFFLFSTTCAGLGLIIIGGLFFRQVIVKKGLPYGVAISVGFIATQLLFIL